jgi:glucose-1-phosphate cytidylyltransferase
MSVSISAVILAGGLGTRIREETEFKPKPMVEIGGKPMLWHIMQHLSYFGVNRFVICAGYKGDLIRDYFLNYRSSNNNFTVNLGKENELNVHTDHSEITWEIIIEETGLETNTGARILQIKKYVENQTFLCTYGDGLSNVNIWELYDLHKQEGRVGTVTAVKPLSRFGILDIGTENNVISFNEKPHIDNWINGGYFIFEPKIFSYLNAESILERSPLESLAKDGELSVHKHQGFWQPMDTFRESKILNEIWNKGNAPWMMGVGR